MRPCWKIENLRSLGLVASRREFHTPGCPALLSKIGPGLDQPYVSHVKDHSVCVLEHDGLGKPWSPSMGLNCSEQLRIENVGLEVPGPER